MTTDHHLALALGELLLATRPRPLQRRLIERLVCSWAGHRWQLLDSGLVERCRDCERTRAVKAVEA